MRLQSLGSLSLITAASINSNRTLSELQTQGSVSLRHEGDTASSLSQVGGTNHRVNRGLLGEQCTDVGVVTVHQNAGGAAGTRCEADQLACCGQGDRQFAGTGEGATDLRNGLSLQQHSCLNVRAGRVPLDFTHCQAVAVGGEQGHGVAIDFYADTGQQRKGLILGHRDLNLLDGFSEFGTVHGTRNFGKLRKLGVIHDRHASQLEVSGTAVNTNHGLICGELHGCIRQGTANFCQDLAGDQANAFCFNIGRNDLTGAGLVIEACDADLTCGGGNQQTVEYGGGRTQRK